MSFPACSGSGQAPSPGRLIALALGFMLAGCAQSEAPQSGGADFTMLAQEAEGFMQARPGHPMSFPRDHGAHPGYRIEWWYLTSNLEDDEGRQYGVQWTLFRYQTRTASDMPAANAWQSEQLYMAHLGVTTPSGHRAFQRYARGGMHGDIAQAGVRADPFVAWLDDWALTSTGAAWLPLEVRATTDSVDLQLDLSATGPIVLHGDDGFSQKHPGGGGSYYYSQPFLRATGRLTIDGEAVAVSGDAWIDREWSSQFLQADQAGWDWFSIHLDSGEKLMLFRLRGQEGAESEGRFRYGTLIAADGSQQALDPSQFVLEELRFETVAGRRLPLAWRISLPAEGRELEVTAFHADQWMDLDYPYWEGVIEVEGASPGSRGHGYLEMTGY